MSVVLSLMPCTRLERRPG